MAHKKVKILREISKICLLRVMRFILVERRDGALASHQCGAGSIPGLDAICGLSLLLVSLLCSKRFFSGCSGYALSSKTNILKFQFDLDFSGQIATLWEVPLQKIPIGKEKYLRLGAPEVNFALSHMLVQ